MPSGENVATGKPVEVAPAGLDQAKAVYQERLNDDGPDEQALAKRVKPDPAEAEAEKPKARRGRPPKAEQARTAAPGGSLSDDARKAGVKGLTQLAAGLCLIASKTTGNQAWTADAITIDDASDDIASACAEVAKADARFAAALDRICASGPYSALIVVAIGVGSQCARNHKPALKIPGTRHPDELLASLEAGNGAAAA